MARQQATTATMENFILSFGGEWLVFLRRRKRKNHWVHARVGGDEDDDQAQRPRGRERDDTQGPSMDRNRRVWVGGLIRGGSYSSSTNDSHRSMCMHAGTTMGCSRSNERTISTHACMQRAVAEETFAPWLAAGSLIRTFSLPPFSHTPPCAVHRISIDRSIDRPTNRTQPTHPHPHSPPRQMSTLETDHVHLVYDQIAQHFSDTRYKPWPIIDRFLHALPTGTLVADVGCGNGKYMAGRRGVCSCMHAALVSGDISLITLLALFVDPIRSAGDDVWRSLLSPARLSCDGHHPLRPP